MNPNGHTIWPFGPKTAIVAAISILFGLLLILVILRVALDWPSQESERIVLLGIFLLSLIPIMLTLVDTMIERGGVVEYAGMKLDFSQTKLRATPDVTIPANIGVQGQPVGDSGTNEILDSLRKAVNNDSVIVDLEEGQAWWETRLLVLIAGAVHHGRPEVVVFVGTDGGVKHSFHGWAFARDLLPHLLKAHTRYPQIYHAVAAATRQWELVEPQGPGHPPDLPKWMQDPVDEPGTAQGTNAPVARRLAQQHSWMAFDYNSSLMNPFYAEQLLASELGEQIERKEGHRAISLVHLADLFRPVLHREQIDEAWPPRRQLDEFFDNDNLYMAVTTNGQFKSLVSRMSVLNTLVGTLVRPE